MTKRLSPQDWIDFAISALAREGFESLKVDILARQMGVSRGSFYWHFADLADFHVKVIAHWKHLATEAVIADVEQSENSAERLAALLLHAFSRRYGLEIRVRAWADVNVDAAQALDAIDRERTDYIQRLLIDAGVPRPIAALRSQLLYWAYLGAVFSKSDVGTDQLYHTVHELMVFALDVPYRPMTNGSVPAN
ncbi:TetR/AcrR family transcriptional regulator [Mesorhizobium sp. KR2-14]|uniref:TetR/AcrR family transcriptional regulator n=1 Tax=Mesorhizobium sp. KR2-14 TaxID=3156610 RepID=UPI0032B5D909